MNTYLKFIDIINMTNLDETLKLNVENFIIVFIKNHSSSIRENIYKYEKEIFKGLDILIDCLNSSNEIIYYNALEFWEWQMKQLLKLKNNNNENNKGNVYKSIKVLLII